MDHGQEVDQKRQIVRNEQQRKAREIIIKNKSLNHQQKQIDQPNEEPKLLDIKVDMFTKEGASSSKRSSLRTINSPRKDKVTFTK